MSYRFAIKAAELECPFVTMVLSACHGRKSVNFLWKFDGGEDWVEIAKANKHTRFIIGSTIKMWAEKRMTKVESIVGSREAIDLNSIRDEAEKFAAEAMPR